MNKHIALAYYMHLKANEDEPKLMDIFCKRLKRKDINAKWLDKYIVNNLDGDLRLHHAVTPDPKPTLVPDNYTQPWED